MQPSLFDDPAPDSREPTAEAAPAVDAPPPDQAARDFAIDPRNHVVLEASAGTGKTRVLVDRYVRLLEANVDPRHILAITFTRKAAAEMRDRILVTLAAHARADTSLASRWAKLADRVADIQVSTIDAFCFGLLREFPLEAGVDPAFEIADETEMARFSAEAMELTLRAIRGLVATDEDVRLLLADVGVATLQNVLALYIDRRHIALPAVSTFVERHVRHQNADAVAAAFIDEVRQVLADVSARALLADGPAGAPEFDLLAADIATLDAFPVHEPGRVRQFEHRLRAYFTTDRGPRQMIAKKYSDAFASPDHKRRHQQTLKAIAPLVARALDRFDDDVNGLLARGLRRVLVIACRTYEQLLEDHALLDFAGMLDRAVELLSRQEEFARSRMKLQSRYHHVLVDEFQDTSRRQWKLVELLVDAWGEGETDAPTSIFVVGDRKQSIYRFRQAEVALLDEAARKIGLLSGGRSATRSITHSFRAVPELLSFVNALGAEVAVAAATSDDRFRYDETDRFPVPPASPGALRDEAPVLGVAVERTPALTAAAIAAEVQRLLATATVRDRHAAPRKAEPDDIAILFRTRAGHRVVEDALAARGIRTYVYKGLGFFDAPEVQDLQALLRYFARPDSNLRAAEWLRSRFVRLSDDALARIAPDFSGAILAPDVDVDALGLAPADRALLERVRRDAPRWIAHSERVTPGIAMDTVMAESAYMKELSGRRLDQARENVKKVRALVRRVENRGYATLDRLAEYFETLRAGEESNAIVAASGCVHLMTVHAAKGLEFPIVFIVNLHMVGKGTGPITVIERDSRGEPHVAFGSSEETKLEDERNREELRRLLYVGVTRARDRLYFSGDLDRQGAFTKRGASLAALLPASLLQQFGETATSGRDEVEWASGSETFAFRVCHAPGEAGDRAEAGAPTPAGVATPSGAIAAVLPPLDVAPLRPTPPVVISATEKDFGSPFYENRKKDFRSPFSDTRLAGTVVHRMLQRRVDPDAPLAELLTAARATVSFAELADVADPSALADEAVALFRALANRPDVRALVDGGICHYEVPFTWRPPDRPEVLIRGAVDCLVELPDGRFVVLEFKTGQPRPSHQAQADLYVQAVGFALGTAAISAQIVYP